MPIRIIKNYMNIQKNGFSNQKGKKLNNAMENQLIQLIFGKKLKLHKNQNKKIYIFR